MINSDLPAPIAPWISHEYQVLKSISPFLSSTSCARYRWYCFPFWLIIYLSPLSPRWTYVSEQLTAWIEKTALISKQISPTSWLMLGCSHPEIGNIFVFFAGHYARYYLVCPLSCLAISLPYHHPGVPNVSKIITLITNLVLVLGQLSCYSRADFGSLTVQCYRNKCSALKNRPYIVWSSTCKLCSWRSNLIIPATLLSLITFRDWNAEIVLLLSDVLWISTSFPWTVFWIQYWTVAWAIFADKSPKLTFSKWLGLLNFVAPFTFDSTTGVHMHHHGPYAWSGASSFWFLMVGGCLQVVVDAICTFKNTRPLPDEAENGSLNECVC